MRAYVRDPELGRPRRQISSNASEGLTEEEIDDLQKGYIDIERQAHLDGVEPEAIGQLAENKDRDERAPARLSL